MKVLRRIFHGDCGFGGGVFFAKAHKPMVAKYQIL